MTKGMTIGAAVAGLVLWGGVVRAEMPQGKTATDVYLDKCSVCHAADGSGATAKGRKLKVKDVRETSIKQTTAQMIDIVMKGKDPDMDSYEKELGADMIRQLVEYYRGLVKTPAKK